VPDPELLAGPVPELPSPEPQSGPPSKEPASGPGPLSGPAPPLDDDEEVASFAPASPLAFPAFEPELEQLAEKPAATASVPSADVSRRTGSFLRNLISLRARNVAPLERTPLHCKTVIVNIGHIVAEAA